MKRLVLVLGAIVFLTVVGLLGTRNIDRRTGPNGRLQEQAVAIAPMPQIQVSPDG